MSNPLETKKMRELLSVKADGNLLKRESTTLEFKQNFDWDVRASRVKYLKTIASFANKTGGYMVFGVSDSPRKLLGITKPFLQIDDSQISQFINQFLSPSPEFEREECEIEGKKFGFIYVYTAETKPIVCIKDYDTVLRESTIYHRYSGQSCIIKSGDLMQMLDETKQKETDKWMKFFSKVSSIGVDNAGIYDSSSGKISTNKGNSFILDEQLLKRIKILDKYSEREDGAEAVKIIGEIDKTGAVINRPFAIHDEEIIKGFLEGKPILQPREYIEAMCYQSSGNMPIYHFIKSADMTLEDSLKILRKPKTRSQAKKRLIERIQNDEKIEKLSGQFPIDETSAIRIKRGKFHNQLLALEEIETQNVGEAKRLLEAICNLNKGNYDSEFVKSVILKLYVEYYESKISTFLRQVICYIDLIENK